MKMVRHYFYRMIAALPVVASLALVRCGNPAGDPLPEGHPFVFKNDSSVELSIRPDPAHPGQGWDAFSLKPGESKTVYSLLGFYDLPGAHAVFYLCRKAGETQQAEEPGQGVAEKEPGSVAFTSVEQEPTTGAVRILNKSEYNIVYFKLVYTDGFQSWEWTPPPGVVWGYNDMNPLTDIRSGEFFLRIRDNSGKEIKSDNFTLHAGDTLDVGYDGEFVFLIQRDPPS
jgi:hypothetical protein